MRLGVAAYRLQVTSLADCKFQSVFMKACFFCFSEESLESEITNVRPLKCPHGPILTNVTLRHELRAGKFSRLGMAEDMETCIQMCCDKDDCEMAFMPGSHCYGVDCFSQQHCEITTVKPSNVTVQIAAVRPIIVNPTKDQIAGTLRVDV